MSSVTANLVAQNTFTDWIAPKKQLTKGVTGAGFLNFAVSGTWAGTITIQKRFDEGSAIDVTDGTTTSNATKLIEDHENGVEYRAGFKTGEYTSGTAAVRLSY